MASLRLHDHQPGATGLWRQRHLHRAGAALAAGALSQVYRINLALFGLSAIACYLAAQQVPLNAEEILWDWHQPLYLLAVYLLLALPFLFAATAVALTLTRYRQTISRIYAADLLGAGLGSLGIILLLFAVFPGTVLKLLGALGLLASLVAARELQGPHARGQAGTLI
ncbi:MAG: hypothetical protein HKM88_00640, partial [Halobacteria archaeon]|nr:hypothetical protein [Halobacteria archaeon]